MSWYCKLFPRVAPEPAPGEPGAPRRPAAGEPFAALLGYCRYLDRCADRRAAQPDLDPAAAAALAELRAEIREVLGAHPLNDDLARLIASAEERLRRMDGRAARA